MKIYRKLFLFFLLLVPVLARVLSYQPERIHGDDILTAYFSDHFNIGKDSFFAPLPQNKVEWVCQFPAVFFVLQKVFFMMLGANLLTIKLSVLPYVFLTTVFLFLILKRIFNQAAASMAVLFYAFYFPALYLETLGLMFISSTAVFLIFFYFLICHLEKPKRKTAILLGFLCGLCYLFYSSSYIALPFLFLAFFQKLIFNKTERKHILINLLISLGAFALTILPFCLYVINNHDFYLSRRYEQVGLLAGEWSERGRAALTMTEKAGLVRENLVLSMRSVWENGLSGHGGYNFGKLAFFSPLDLIIFSLGCLSAVIIARKRKRMKILLIFEVILITFISGIVLTIPPPAFHRFSLVFPFIIMIFAALFYEMLSINRFRRVIIFAVIILIIYVSIDNFQRYTRSTASEAENENIKLAKYIHTAFPRRKLYAAAFPGFSFEKNFYFVEKDQRKVMTDYHKNFLNSFNKNEKYVYVIIFPETFDEQFMKADPQGKIMKFSTGYHLFVN